MCVVMRINTSRSLMWDHGVILRGGACLSYVLVRIGLICVCRWGGGLCGGMCGW